MITSFKFTLILTCCRFFFRTQIDFGQLFFFSDNPSHNVKVLNSDSNRCLINLHFSYFKSKNIFGKCCWKVSSGITILIGHTCFGLTCILEETSGSNTSSTCLLTCLIKFKLGDVISLTSWFDQIDVGTTMVFIENNLCFVANIKSYSSSDIP